MSSVVTPIEGTKLLFHTETELEKLEGDLLNATKSQQNCRFSWKLKYPGETVIGDSLRDLTSRVKNDQLAKELEIEIEADTDKGWPITLGKLSFRTSGYSTAYMQSASEPTQQAIARYFNKYVARKPPAAIRTLRFAKNVFWPLTVIWLCFAGISALRDSQDVHQQKKELRSRLERQAQELLDHEMHQKDVVPAIRLLLALEIGYESSDRKKAEVAPAPEPAETKPKIELIIMSILFVGALIAAYFLVHFVKLEPLIVLGDLANQRFDRIMSTYTWAVRLVGFAFFDVLLVLVQSKAFS